MPGAVGRAGPSWRCRMLKALTQKIDAGLTEDEMWRILRQILDAMRFYTGTKYNIIHRDLKP